MKKRARILRKSIMSLFLCLCLIVSPLAGTGLVASAEGTVLYSQDFTEVTDVSAVAAVSKDAQAALKIATDETHGNYLSFDLKPLAPGGGRGARVRMAGLDVSAQTAYIVEFDAALRPANSGASSFVVTGADFRYSKGGGDDHMNTGVGKGYLLNLTNAGANSTAYTINGGKEVTIPNEEWCHYVLYVDKTQAKVSTTITSASGVIADKVISAYTSADNAKILPGSVEGFYMLNSRNNGATLIDNFVVREVGAEDEFGVEQVVEEVTVTFDLNGHGDAIDAVKVVKEKAVEAPTAPKAEGYVFIGWYTDAACTTAWDFATKVTADTTLYAKWVADPAEDGSDAIYYQGFKGDVNVTTIVTSTNAGAVLAADEVHGYYADFSIASAGAPRNMTMNFTGVDVSAKNTYVVEFDAVLAPAGENKNENHFAVKGADFANTNSDINAGAASGYILKLNNGGGKNTAWKINDTEETVTIPNGEWCHYKLCVDKKLGQVSISITGETTGNIADKKVVAMNGDGNVAGLYARLERSWGSVKLDNVKVYEEVVVVEATGVTLNKTEAALKVGENVTLEATVAPENATDKTVNWKSSDEAVATVADGVVTAVAAGTATITVSTANGKTATCAVTVEAATVEVTGVTLDKSEATVKVGETVTLEATVAPENATDKALSWKSSDETVATVADGKVTAVKAGTATITVSTANGKTATCAVTVEAEESGDKITVTHNGKFDFGNKTVGEGFTKVLSSQLYEEGKTEYGFQVVNGSISDYGIGGTGSLMEDAIRVVFNKDADNVVTPGVANFVVVLEPGTYKIKIGTGNADKYQTAFAFKNAAGESLCDNISYTEEKTFHEDEREVEITDGKLVIEITGGKTRFASIAYVEIEKVFKPVEWTFGDEYLVVKPFTNAALEETAIGATGFKVATPSSNYNNVVVRNNDKTHDSGKDIGYWPYTLPEGDDYYLFIGAGGNSALTSTLTLPEVVPAGKQITITFAKTSGTNNGTANRGAANEASTMTIGSKVLDLKNDFDFTVWNTKAIVTDSEVSNIVIDLGKWGSVAIAKIEVSEPSAVEGTEYSVVADATGNSTAVDISTLVSNDNVKSYMITTSKEGKLVSQTIVKNVPASVDTTGADKVEIAPVFTYNVGTPGELGKGGYDIQIPSGTYDFTLQKTGKRTDIYVNDQMLVNNMLQNGDAINTAKVKDVVITGDLAKISITDSQDTAAIIVEVVKSPVSVTRVQKVYVLGDSLVANYYNGGSAENNVQTGWGQVLADYMTNAVDVLNLGNSGVTAIGLYNSAFSHIKGSAKSGDILILESGYNDANKDYTTEAEMRTAVTNMVNEAKALGVKVILVSPNASAHDYKESVKYTGVMADLATTLGTDYIDLSKLSYKVLTDLYGSDTTVVKEVWNVSDTLHSTYFAANKWASIIAGELYKMDEYKAIVNGDYVFAFSDSKGNVISCSASGKMAEGYAKVTFDPNGVDAVASYKVVKVGEKVSKPASPTAGGYVFDGWYKDAACTTKWDFEVDTVTGTTTLYAGWQQLAAGTLYSQNFTDVTDASTVAGSKNGMSWMTIKSEEGYGNYLSFDLNGSGQNSRGGNIDFAKLDTTKLDAYVVEFDAAIKPGDKDTTYFTLKDTDMAYNSNNYDWGTASGYIFNMQNAGSSGVEYTINGVAKDKVEIPSGEWCHYKIYVDKTQGYATLSIAGEKKGSIVDLHVIGFKGKGDVTGLYMLAGRYNATFKIDNILVREVDETDKFGEIVEEVLSSVEFTSQLNQVITQPANAVHLPITVKANGNLGGDLTADAKVEWKVVGLEEEDGYISLTKAEGTGSGTEGEEPDGTTAYFNVRNGVSNYFGYVEVKVTVGELSQTLTTPFAVLGGSAASANQLAPVGGYPVCMDEYADSLIDYYGTENSMTGKDLILNNWSYYGSNNAKFFKLSEKDGKKAIEFNRNGGSNSAVAVYQWVDQAEQYVVDFTAMFTADMTVGVFYKTPNNSGNNPEWSMSYNADTLTFGTETISGIAANAWYRYVVSVDPSLGTGSVAVYDSTGTLVGELNDVEIANNIETQSYFCFHGATMYLNSFTAYKPVLDKMVVGTDADTVRVPEAGGAATTVDFSASLTSKEGVKMTGAVTWSLAEEYANVELKTTGGQTAKLTVNTGAAGTVTVVATKDGVRAEKTIQLTTSSNVVSITADKTSITIPFAGEDAVVAKIEAVTRNGEGEVIDGGAITYTLLAKDGVTETTLRGATFENGVLTVPAGASPAVVYVKATNAEGLSAKIKVNIHGLSFAFGSADAADGFTLVGKDLYTEKLGYGFANTDGLTVNESNVTGTSDFRFKATVPNGNYTVKVTTSAASMTSEVVESVSAVTGIEKKGASFNVAVCDGVLDLTFPANATVSSIEISQMAAKEANAKPHVYAIGDSTTKNDANGALSWGNCVEGKLVAVPDVFGGFASHGMAGRDSVNFYNEARVEAVLLAVCPGDYVTVNMGINGKTPGEAGAYYTMLSKYYVDGILQRGGIPVIVTATPDGPVGDKVASNYNSTTGKFTNSRGDGVRNDVLRQIAAEKGLAVIELGQWGQDWMNTLTKGDVTAYNTANGTSFTTVLEMVQSWYVDHNHYKQYLGIQIGNYIFKQLERLTEDRVVVEDNDFEREETTKWDMTGDLAADVKVTADATGNIVVQLQSTSNVCEKNAVKNFGEMPNMSKATIEFKWYTNELRSDSKGGYGTVRLSSNGKEVVALYHNDIRDAGNTTNLYYSTNGFGNKVASNVSVLRDGMNMVSVELNFDAHTVTVYVNNKVVAEDVTFAGDIFNVNEFVLAGAGGLGNSKTFSWNAAFDDFEFSYVERTEKLPETIYSLGELESVSITREQWKAGYTHPTSVSAMLANGKEITVDINADTWKCEEFDENVKGQYTWTAEIIAPAEHANDKGLKVSYQMEYSVPYVSTHDYENDFTFASDMIANVALGSSVDQYSGTGAMNYVLAKDANGNSYLNASQTNVKGNRGSRLDLSELIIKGAEVTFDWMPIECNDKAYGQVTFVSPAGWHSYFALRFDHEFKITAYTENTHTACKTVQKEFEGSYGESNPIDTGLSGKDKWYSVSVKFDYINHTADFTITEKADPTKTFTLEDFAIETEANGLRSMLFYLYKVAEGATTKMGIDNIAVDYDVFGTTDIVKVTNPVDVSVAMTAIDEFEFPATVIAELGDGTKIDIPVTNWTATPEFDKATPANYVWTADLVLGSYTNHFDLHPSFTMTYTALPYPTYVYSPATLELDKNEVSSVDPANFPKTVIAHMSDGSVGTVEVGEWTAIRAFNADEEGIYVYGANVVAKDGVYDVVAEKMRKNENPDDPAAQRADYVYDVYYRISYYELNDNYNGYERTMEYLDRGVYAVATGNGVFVSWRLLATEYGKDISFNVYRNGQLVNTTPITTKTNFVDENGRAGDLYTVAKIEDGKFYESEPVVASAKNYLSIPVQKPEGLKDKDGNVCTYTMNDGGTADVDGDGQYEYIIKWIPNDAFDSGQAGGPSGPTLFDVYELDGTALWRLNLGLEMPSGAHFNQFALYDLDEDGKAELFIKTSDGSVTYKPNASGLFDMNDESTIVSYVGDKNVVPGTNVTGNGHVSASSNEYVSVFNGMTGEEIDTIDYINVTGNFADWGKEDGGNRSARYNIGIAYLPADKSDANCTTTIPAVLFNRGYYGKTTVAAYTLREGQLTLEWNFSIPSSDINAAKGNHNLATGDIDKDGFDEVVLGAIAIDHDGTLMWAKNGLNGQDNAGHADAIHMAAMNPNKNDLYVFTPQEHKDATYNHSLSNAGTGARYLASWFETKDVGRGVAANITPNPGYEFWSASGLSSGVYGFDGSLISTSNVVVSMNWVLYWDGDLLSELADGNGTEGATKITKYNWETNVSDTLAIFDGTKHCNWSKNSPSLTADVLGDWREEVIVRSDDETELRIYMTTYETEYMIYTLMHDPVYRNAIVAQNSSYNQPAHVGIYLGEDNRDVVLGMGLDTASIVYTVEEEEEGSDVPDRPVAPVLPEVPETPEEPTVNVEEDPDLSWDAIEEITSEKVAEAEKEAVQTSAPVNVNFTRVGENTVPVSVLSSIKGKNVTVAFQSGNGAALSVNGADLKNTNLVALGNVNMTINTNKNAIPESVVVQKPAELKRQLSVGGNSNFGMHVNLHVSVGAEKAGKYANLYRYNTKTGALEYCGYFKVTANGQAMFAVSAGGDYLVTVTGGMVKENVVYAGGGYVVQSGDNLCKIASRYNMSLADLIRKNPQLTNPDVIKPGEVINVK